MNVLACTAGRNLPTPQTPTFSKGQWSIVSHVSYDFLNTFGQELCSCWILFYDPFNAWRAFRLENWMKIFYWWGLRL